MLSHMWARSITDMFEAAKEYDARTERRIARIPELEIELGILAAGSLMHSKDHQAAIIVAFMVDPINWAAEHPYVTWR